MSAPTSLAKGDPTLPGRRVLVIDDDFEIRLMLALTFEQAGYSVVTAASGAEGLKAARLTRPSVIVLDLMMPVMDGHGFRARQRADPELGTIPVIVVSAAHDLGQKTKHLDAVAVFTKPFDFNALLEAVAEAGRQA
jgi:CheY-like chemotaxis protein